MRCDRHLWLVDGRERAGRRVDGQPPPTVVRAFSAWSCEADVTELVRAGRRFTVRELAAMIGVADRTFRAWVQRAWRKLRAQPEARKLLEEMKAA